MKTFPMFLQMAGRRVVIVGGGEQAAQKCRLMLKTEAEIVVAATELDDELSLLADQGRIFWHQNIPTKDLFFDVALVFIATGNSVADFTSYKLAKSAGALVNVVDQPELCDALTPSIVDRDPVVIAIGTEGTAPVLARKIKTDIEQILEPDLGDLAALAGRLRNAVAKQFDPSQRRQFWRWVFNDAPRKIHRSGSQRAAAKMIKSAISDGPDKIRATPVIAFVGAGPGARDLLTLRAVQRLQEADIIFYDDPRDVQVLELARRDAKRVKVAKIDSWDAHRMPRLMIAAADQGQSVVRLVHGNTQQNDAYLQELNHLKTAGYFTEVVPGISGQSSDQVRSNPTLEKIAVGQS